MKRNCVAPQTVFLSFYQIRDDFGERLLIIRDLLTPAKSGDQLLLVANVCL